jgi:hypothetical protein
MPCSNFKARPFCSLFHCLTYLFLDEAVAGNLTGENNNGRSNTNVNAHNTNTYIKKRERKKERNQQTDEKINRAKVDSVIRCA